MDPILLILGMIGFAIVSAISNHLEKKKLREQEEEARRSGHPLPTQQRERQAPTPGSMADWQEQLRRMLNPEASPEVEPPVMHPMPEEPPAPPPRATPPPTLPRAHPASMRPSKALYEKAHQLQEQVARRVQIIEDQKTGMEKDVKSDIPQRPAPRVRRVRPTARRSAPAQGAVRLLRNKYTIRDAFVASVILGPPAALESEKRAV